MGPEDAESATADAEPTNAELAAILAGGRKPEARGQRPEARSQRPEARSQKPEEGDDSEESPDQDDDAEDDNEETAEDAADEADDADDDADGDEEPEDSEDEPTEKDKAADEADESDEEEPEDADTKAARAKFTPEQQKLFDKAIKKKTRRIMEVRGEATRLKAALEAKETELEELSSKAPAAVMPTRADPLAAFDTEAALDTHVEEMKTLRRWARAHPQGGTIGDQEVSAERAAVLLDDADEVITEHAPKRRELLRQRAAGEAEAIKALPALKDKTSETSVGVQSLLRQWGNLRLRDIPAVKLVLADVLAGRKVRTAKPATPSAGDKKKVAPKAPAAPAGGARPPKVGAAVKAAGGASKTLEATGDDPDNAALSSLLQLRR